MVDDLLGVAECGHDSLSLNIFINTQIELKKLKFHTQDLKGKSKCNVMHIGNDKQICPQLQVHGTVMQKISHDKYLGDIISPDGRNDLNIQSRASKGVGLVTQIMHILEKVTLGKYYFKAALMLRESIFLNRILTNAEVWYGLTSKQISQLEAVDKMLLRICLDTPVSTPAEGIQLELGVLSINTIIKARRINYLHYLLTTSESEMIHRVFMMQWKQPVKSDWTEQVKVDLFDFNIQPNLDVIKKQFKNAFKKLVKEQAHIFEFSNLMQKKQTHSKMDSLNYIKLELQDYLKLGTVDAVIAKTVFKYRTRMATFGENFRGKNGPVNCPLCGLHLDSQFMGFYNCQVLKNNIEINCKYEDIFRKSVPKDVATSLYEIDNFREEEIKSI